MADFEGYLLEINGVQLPNRYINMETYSSKPVIRKVIKKYTTADGVDHEIYSGHTTSEISFSTSTMKLAAVNAFLAYFPVKSGLTIKFWNQDSQEYYTAITFKVEDLEFKHYKVRGNDIIYQPITVVMRSL
jgi:hypothetical protein